MVEICYVTMFVCCLVISAQVVNILIILSWMFRIYDKKLWRKQNKKGRALVLKVAYEFTSFSTKSCLTVGRYLDQTFTSERYMEVS